MGTDNAQQGLSANAIPASSVQWVWIGGRFVPPEDAVVSVFDRSFLYGDGLFEGIPVHGGRLFRWEQHLARLQRGAVFLRIRLPHTDAELHAAALELVGRQGWTEAFVRLHLSRGVGRRGYSTRGADSPCVVMSIHPALPAASRPTAWKLATASVRLPAGDVLGTHKTASKLAQVMARMEAEDAGVDEALLLDTDGHVAEGASSNVFWVVGDTVCTPSLTTGALAGVTRQVVLELCERMGRQCRETKCGPGELAGADAVFVTVSSLGIVPVSHLDGHPLHASPVVAELQAAYAELTDESAVG